MSRGCRGMVIAVAVAVLSVVIFHRSSPVFLGFFLESRSLAESLRAPGPGVSGWIARKMMAIVNAESNVDVVESLLSVHSGHTVVELGPGHGFSLREILRKEPAHVYAIEVSESFRSTLAADSDFSKAVEDKVLEIRGDAGPRLPFIPSESVDRLLGMNVLQFLDPLEEYVDEVYRVLKPGGLVVWGNKDVAKAGDPAVFVNTDWDKCAAVMSAAGFEVTSAKVRLSGKSAYLPLVGRKPRAGGGGREQAVA
eukprot:CAMPEP_0118823436 /NCGR_PEP_ID=MMETSP1162-20130426/9909_1 /TAXON_ID=33656 /ORGANISM="Phaeocystis Sp, Strain CCMP2710" /LENGTH=251 /DNA_ID=CAMNT_0006754049 /DNA_START=14 /DNA_END=769 /DNA_ORIENTATION=-